MARYGGEEFAVILPNTDITGACHMAKSIQTAVSRMGIPHGASSAAGHVTISLGVTAAIPSEALDADAFIKKADIALYEAKKQGRNRVIC